MPDSQPQRLTEPLPITEHQWPDNVKPLVSIRCITYNHAPFIEQCIKGFLMQKTTFPVEIIIHDDASDDGTADIVRGYIDKYPRLIKGVLQPENLRSQGIPWGRFVVPLLRGDYIAVCEGDDYWIDPLKLQTQVIFLEENPDYVISGHDVVEVDENDDKLKDRGMYQLRRRDHSREELIRNEAWLFPLTWVYRNIPVPKAPEKRRVINGDVFFLSLIGHFGKAKFHHDILPAAYRRHAGGIWSLVPEDQRVGLAANTWFWLHRYYARVGEGQYANYYRDRYVHAVLGSMPSSKIVKELLRRIPYLERVRRQIRKALRAVKT